MGESKKIVPKCNILRWRMLEKEFVELRKAGKTLDEIGSLFGFSTGSVSRHKAEIMQNTGCGEELFSKYFYARCGRDSDEDVAPKTVSVKILDDFSFTTDDENMKKILADKEGLDSVIYHLLREELVQDITVREMLNLAKLLLYVRGTNREIEYSYKSRKDFDFFLKVKAFFV